MKCSVRLDNGTECPNEARPTSISCGNSHSGEYPDGNAQNVPACSETSSPTPLEISARKLHHWHDTLYNEKTGKCEGMVVSADVVREIWAALSDSSRVGPVMGPDYEAAGDQNFSISRDYSRVSDEITKKINELGANHNLEYCDCEFCLFRSWWHSSRVSAPSEVCRCEKQDAYYFRPVDFISSVKMCGYCDRPAATQKERK